MKTLSITLVILLAFVSTTYACPFSDSKDCSVGQASCGANDYLGVSDAELAILGKDTFHANIAMIEQALKERGVSLPEKGFVTSEFRSALIAFQESVGIPSNGEINHLTLDKLGVKF
jgi:hypothetical protein